MLREALNNLNIPVEAQCFPDRTTLVGTVLNDFLSKKQNLPPEAAHLLFSANRWECEEKMLETLHSGTTLIIDRYAASGAAFAAATTGRSLGWCRTPDKGLPRPDIVFLLNVSEVTQSLRHNWGNERFENLKLQRQVMDNYEKLKDNTWRVIDADQKMLNIHSQIMDSVPDIIERVKDLPIDKLYDSDA